MNAELKKQQWTTLKNKKQNGTAVEPVKWAKQLYKSLMTKVS